MSITLKFSKTLKELRLHLCQKSSSSKGARDFIENYYVDLKKSNPQFPFLIRECSGVEPKLWARLDSGKEKVVFLKNLTDKDVLLKVKSLT